jgi:hypothetical protein
LRSSPGPVPAWGLRKIERNEGEKFDVAGARFTWKVKGEDTGYVEETDRANPFASMPGKEAMARIGELSRRFDMHFFPFSPPPPISSKCHGADAGNLPNQQGTRTGPRRRFVHEADTTSSRSTTSGMTSRVG